MSEPKSISELQNRLPENAQVLEYALLEDKIITWIITKTSIQTTETKIIQSEPKSKIKQYLDILQNGNDQNELKKLAQEFYQILLSPNEKFLDSNKTLFIVPDKDLNFLPFASLINLETGKYLIEDFQIGIAPSLNIFVINSEKAKANSINSTETIISIGNPFFNREQHQELNYLPAAKREAETIGDFYDSPTILVEKNATKERVLAEIPKAEVIHFAAHAVTDEDNPLLSNLLLADSGQGKDDFLNSGTIYGLKLPKTKLVVLSACQTGIERAFRGEGAIGLARPFIALGVPLVVASLWKVDSDSTAELMIHFHRFRKQKNLKTSEALQKAQIEMIHSQNELFRSPKMWASFILIGG